MSIMIFTQHHGKKMDLVTVLFDLASQEGNDGDEGNAMQAAGEELRRMEVVVEAAQDYTYHYDAENWSRAMKEVENIRREVKALAALEAKWKRAQS